MQLRVDMPGPGALRLIQRFCHPAEAGYRVADQEVCAADQRVEVRAQDRLSGLLEVADRRLHRTDRVAISGARQKPAPENRPERLEQPEALVRRQGLGRLDELVGPELVLQTLADDRSVDAGVAAA